MAEVFIPREVDGTYRLILDDRESGLFKVARRAFTDLDVLQRERDQIFDRCWLYVGHASELKAPNDFLTRSVGGRDLIFNRDRKGTYQAFLNTCPHRGALIAREKCGNALGFKCFYHGWSFNNNGKYSTRTPIGVYPENFGADCSVDLYRVPRLEVYKDFYFVNFDANAISLPDYLADAKEMLDLLYEQSPDGMEIIGGEQQYSIRANWKLLVENSVDGYHAAETHSTYFEYLVDSVGSSVTENMEERIAKSHVLSFGNGHAAIEQQGPWGRPIARWIPAWGEDARAEITSLVSELEGRVGPQRAERIYGLDRNIIIFPNLVINDIMAITVRTFFPEAPDQLNVTSWALAPKGEKREFRKRRLDNFLEFLGPGGFATPDDVEALESAQRGYRNQQYAPWNDISRGMLKAAPAVVDEAQMRCFWREWAKRMESAE
ncbi:Rieske 2Fe-2S domain-containing protein [Pandoraea fibrosis]|uniref:Rieske 2Fe-2S domain-containing protein n=1 Tax=Pandoraea fibrosis TaxID=1891094 RepID=A0ABX6HVP4_9BURK|nr:aromatic ring-hydroxylating dioxygenase subunit alpha [Pandoraea fibrosis]QHE91520.1 Rieske 2Fe-2S domain-containing protein [Pandoraea fibrosis]QHF14922.1 Rieske 2Fe-2S domain-containing protein [Pandoraea fibrosis]